MGSRYWLMIIFLCQSLGELHAEEKKPLQLLQELDSDTYEIREQATRALIEAGDKYRSLVRAQLEDHPISPEEDIRLRRILAEIDFRKIDIARAFHFQIEPVYLGISTRTHSKVFGLALLEINKDSKFYYPDTFDIPVWSNEPTAIGPTVSYLDSILDPNSNQEIDLSFETWKEANRFLLEKALQTGGSLRLTFRRTTKYLNGDTSVFITRNFDIPKEILEEFRTQHP